MAAKKPVKKAAAKTPAKKVSAPAKNARRGSSKSGSDLGRITSNIPSNRSTQRAWEKSDEAGLIAASKMIDKLKTGTNTWFDKRGKVVGTSPYFDSAAAEQSAWAKSDAAGRKAQLRQMQNILRTKKKK